MSELSEIKTLQAQIEALLALCNALVDDAQRADYGARQRIAATAASQIRGITQAGDMAEFQQLCLMVVSRTAGVSLSSLGN